MTTKILMRHIGTQYMFNASHLLKARTPEEKSPRITKGHVVKPVAADIQIDIGMPKPKEQKDEKGHQFPFTNNDDQYSIDASSKEKRTSC